MGAISDISFYDRRLRTGFKEMLKFPKELLNFVPIFAVLFPVCSFNTNTVI